MTDTTAFELGKNVVAVEHHFTVPVGRHVLTGFIDRVDRVDLVLQAAAQLRELFGPGFLAWVTTMTGEIDFGVNDRQLWFLWRLRERSEEELKAALKKEGRDDIMIVVGGVIPPQDFDELRAAGAAAIFPPGTVIAAAADDLLDQLADRLGYSL